MTERMKAAKAFLAGLAAAGTALWGWFGWLTILWIICMVLDYLSGSMAAMKARDWNSAKAREGLWHKTGMIVAVLAAGLGDIIIGTILRTDGLRLLLKCITPESAALSAALELARELRRTEATAILLEAGHRSAAAGHAKRYAL